MAAPIRLFDARLMGNCLTMPFEAGRASLLKAFTPLHPKANILVECALRALRFLAFLFLAATTYVPFLIGQTVKAIHFIALPKDIRKAPDEEIEDNMKLPQLVECLSSLKQVQYGVCSQTAVKILRHGLPITQGKVGNAFYIDQDLKPSVENDWLTLHFDLQPGAVGYLSDDSLDVFKRTSRRDFTDKKTSASFRKLLLKNGYKAVMFDQGAGKVAWAVYDLASVEIRGLKLAPHTCTLS